LAGALLYLWWHMAWDIKASEKTGWIEVRYRGRVSSAELSAGCAETLRLAQETKRTRILADCSALEGGHSVVDLYTLAEGLAKSGTGRLLKEAVVLPRDPVAEQNVRFWQTTAQNHGLRVAVFPDRAGALAWLEGDNPPPKGNEDPDRFGPVTREA
jgi:hypothetical protein